MTRLSGRVPETGTAIEGATVAVVDTQGVEDPAQWTVVAWDTTDANGEWAVSGLDPAATERYHAIAQYDSGTEFVNFESLPYLSTPADAFAPRTPVTVGTPTPSVSVGSAIPDSGDLHARYDATKLSLSDGESVTTWTDQTGNGHDLTAGTAPVFKTSIINGNSVVRFDGADDFLDVAFSALSQPNHVFIVAKFNAAPSTSGNEAIFGADSADFHSLYNGGNDTGGNWTLFAGTVLDSGISADTSAHIHGSLFNGANSEMRLDGATSATGNAGTNALKGFTTGNQYTGSGFGPVDIGEILLYPQDKSASASEIESYLSDKWGITI